MDQLPYRLVTIPSRHHAKSCRLDPAARKQRIKSISRAHLRHGDRCVHHILRREGWAVNAKKVCSPWRELGLQLRNKAPKRRVKAKLREERLPALPPDDVWPMNFGHDQRATARKWRIPAVSEICSRFSPLIDARFRCRGKDMVATLWPTPASPPWQLVGSQGRRNRASESGQPCGEPMGEQLRGDQSRMEPACTHRRHGARKGIKTGF
ncbi:MAG: hypothetical protein SNJ79_13340 [Sphingomonadaceae bacterium]